VPASWRTGVALAAHNRARPAGRSAGIVQAQNSISPVWPVTVGALLLGAGAYLISTQHDTISSEVFGGNDNSQLPVVTNTSTTTSTH
jgi:hypothetical protein